MSADATFAPTDAALRARLDAVDPEAYARTRNALDGAVTRLSPYLSHGFVDVPAVLADVRRRHRVPQGHKLSFELAWREYFQHVRRHFGDAILSDLKPPPYAGRYAHAMPDDVLEARSGVPAIDHAVRALYADGWLHNHARMWVASYLVHLRKVHWRAGADWMHAHLLDGDPASNHLSWQWVAGTFSTKPYLFDAGNVARYAPRAWHCRGTAVDRSYEELEALARGEPDVGPEPRSAGAHRPATEPPATLDGWPLRASGDVGHVGTDAADAAADRAARRVDAAGLIAWLRARLPNGGPVRVVHPWALARPEPGDATPRVGLLHAPREARLPWSVHRGRFVMRRLADLVEVACVGDADRVLHAMQAAGYDPVVRMSLEPGLREALEDAAARGARIEPVPREFDDPDEPCRSFSRFWSRVAR